MTEGETEEGETEEGGKERGEQIAIHHAVPFMETSAKLNLNVTEAFREISLRILEKVRIFEIYFNPSNG